MLDRIIGGCVAELLFYILVWGILLPISMLLVTPVFLIRALLHPTTAFEILAHDYRSLFRWWLGHFPFEERPRVPAEPDEMRSDGRRHEDRNAT